MEEVRPDVLVEKPKNKLRKLATMGGLALMSMLGLKGDSHLEDTMFLSHRDSVTSIDDTISVMTANVHGWRDTNGNSNFDDFVNAIEQEQPDVACLQEVLADGGELQSLFNSGYNVYFDTTIFYPIRGRFGNAVISRAPIKTTETLDLPNPKTVTPRNALLFEIETADSHISMVNTHLSINSSEAEQQSAKLANHIDPGIEILCGDLNQRPHAVRTGSFGRMAAASLLSGDILTFPANKPSRQIDYVLSACGEADRDEQRTVFIGSDHLARIEVINISACEQ